LISCTLGRRDRGFTGYQEVSFSYFPGSILFFVIIHNGLFVFSPTMELDPGDMYTFFMIASLTGGRAPDRDP
jgi:hypothetical protein